MIKKGDSAQTLEKGFFFVLTLQEKVGSEHLYLF